MATLENERKYIPIRVIGDSMFPVLHDGDIVIISPRSRYMVNDIVVVRKKSFCLIHRIIAIREIKYTNYYLTKGDNVNNIDRWFEEKDIIGKVIHLASC